MINWVKKDIRRRKNGSDVYIRSSSSGTCARISFNDANSSLSKCEYIEIGIDCDKGRMYFKESDEMHGYKVYRTVSQFIISTSSQDVLDYIKESPNLRDLYYDKELGLYYIQKEGR